MHGRPAIVQDIIKPDTKIVTIVPLCYIVVLCIYTTLYAWCVSMHKVLRKVIGHGIDMHEFRAYFVMVLLFSGRKSMLVVCSIHVYCYIICLYIHYTERDIQRLKWNWLFATLASILGSLNYTCVLPTNHQYIINPTAESLNTTNEVMNPIA